MENLFWNDRCHCSVSSSQSQKCYQKNGNFADWIGHARLCPNNLSNISHWFCLSKHVRAHPLANFFTVFKMWHFKDMYSQLLTIILSYVHRLAGNLLVFIFRFILFARLNVNGFVYLTHGMYVQKHRHRLIKSDWAVLKKQSMFRSRR